MIRERILIYLGFKGISKYKFYQKTGFSNGFLDKLGAIGSDKCEKICADYPELNPTWLITGKGEMILTEELQESKKTILDLENERMLNEIKELSKEDQERILITMDALIRDSKNKKSKK